MIEIVTKLYALISQQAHARVPKLRSVNGRPAVHKPDDDLCGPFSIGVGAQTEVSNNPVKSLNEHRSRFRLEQA